MTNPGGGFTTPQGPLVGTDGRPLQQQQFQQGFPQQPAPQQQQQQFNPQQLQGADLNQRLQGPGIPQELQGRTVGEALRYYGVMREDFRRRNQQPQQLQGQPTQQFQQQQVPQQQYQQPQQDQQGWPPQQVPQGQQVIDQMVDARVAQAIQPLQQVSIATVYAAVKARFADWGNYDVAIQQSLTGSQPQMLLDPGVWEAAYYHAKGKAQSQPVQQQQQGQGQQIGWENGQPVYAGQGFQNGMPQQQMNTQQWQTPPQQQQQQQQQQLDQWGRPIQYTQLQYPQQPQQQNSYVPGPVDQWGRPLQPQQQQPYFVEGPTPQMPQNAGVQQSSAMDEQWARKFGITVEQYRSAKGGRIPPMPLTPQQLAQQNQPWSLQGQYLSQQGFQPMNGNYNGR